MFDSAHLITSSPYLLIAVAVMAVLSFLEYKLRLKWVMLMVEALFYAATFVMLLYLGAVLADVLLFLLAVIFARVCLIFFEGRRHA